MFLSIQKLNKHLGASGGKLVKKTVNVAILTLICCSYPFTAFADGDELSGVMTSVKSNFGTDSTFIKLLYLAEVIVGVYTYHKTKNIPVLLGIVIVSLFLNFALGHWVFNA